MTTMVSNNLPDWFENNNPSKVLIPGGYHKMREPYYIWIPIWVKTTSYQPDTNIDAKTNSIMYLISTIQGSKLW